MGFDRLSERNCIEIVTKLIAEKQLEVVHTLDGKEYVTPAQITKEIRDELHVCGGKCDVFLLPLDLGVTLEGYEKILKVFSTPNLSEKVSLLHLYINSPTALLISLHICVKHLDKHIKICYLVYFHPCGISDLQII